MAPTTRSLLCTAILLLAAPFVPAEIVHVPISQTLVSRWYYDSQLDKWGGSFETYDVDVNSDGINDLIFYNSATAIMGLFPSGSSNLVYGPHGASLVAALFNAGHGSSWLATPLLLGAPIGPDATMNPSADFFCNDAYESDFPLGDIAWTQSPDKYLGFQFTIADQPHFGWVQISEAADASSLTIHDAAYETQPNTPLHAGEVPEPACATVSAGVATLLLTHRRRRHPIFQH